MERYVRVGLYFAAGGATISLLAGVITGVSLAVAILRALGGSVFFFAVGAGAAAAAAKWLPEISRFDEFDDDGPGVNIVVEDDLESPVEDDGAEPAFEDHDFVEEVHEGSVENEEQVMREAIDEERHGAAFELDRTEVDQMPDIGALASAFVSPEHENGEADTTEEADWSVEPAPAGARGDGNDPVEIARAIQTMLHKDDE